MEIHVLHGAVWRPAGEFWQGEVSPGRSTCRPGAEWRAGRAEIRDWKGVAYRSCGMRGRRLFDRAPAIIGDSTKIRGLYQLARCCRPSSAVRGRVVFL